MKKIFTHFKTVAFIAAVHFLSLSLFSGFRFDHIKSFNWDIALMLSPYGISNNLLIESDHYLAPYYYKSTQLPESHSFSPAIFLIAVQIGLSFYCLYLYKKRSQ